MKKILLVFMAAMLATSAWSNPVKIGDLYYWLYEDEEVAYVDNESGFHTKYNGLVVANIPSWVTYDGIGYPVKGLKYEAFSGSPTLISASVPSSVEVIGEGAFSSCESLVEVNLPNSITSLGKSTFSGCRSLSSIVIPNSVIEIKIMYSIIVHLSLV